MITGLSPQIVTETLFAYYVGLKIDDSIPAEVHLITTREGGDRAQLTLLGPTTAHFDNLVSTYKINHLSFLEENIHVLKNKSGQELEDISTPADNSIAADFICEMTNKFTRDGDTELFVSIAGGRKTMGYYAGYALTLFGRPQDRLSHVLVSEEFENNRDFYFPTIKRQIIYSKKNKPLDTSKAIVTLAQIPFVQLRHELPEDSLLQQVGFQEAVALINVSNEKLVVTLNTSELSLSINTRKVHFEPIDFIFYLWFAEQLRSESGFIQEPHDQEPNPIYAAELVNVMDKFGFINISGSSNNKKGRGITIYDLKKIIKNLRKGYSLAITPDGPRGPRYKINSQVVNIAKLSGAKIIPSSCSISRSIRLNSWDRFVFPLPFSTLSYYFDQKIAISKHIKKEEIENKNLEIENKLNKCRERLDFIFKTCFLNFY